MAASLAHVPLSPETFADVYFKTRIVIESSTRMQLSEVLANLCKVSSNKLFPRPREWKFMLVCLASLRSTPLHFTIRRWVNYKFINDE